MTEPEHEPVKAPEGEEEEKKEEQPEEKKEETPEASPSPIDEAKETLTKLEEQNKIMSANIAKQEKLNAEALLAGRAPAGQGATKEQKIKQDAFNLIKGSGWEYHAFPELEPRK